MILSVNPNYQQNMKTNNALKLLIIVAISTLGMADIFSQTTIDWNNPLGGDFLTSTNWTPNADPTSSYNVDFKNANSGGTYTVTFGLDATVSRLWVRTGNQTFDLDGHTLTLVGTGTFNFGFDGSVNGGTTIFKDGNVISRNFYMGGGTSDAGRTVRFDNVDFSLKNNDTFYSLSIGISTHDTAEAGRKNNTLEITNGSIVRASSIAVGHSHGATGNTVKISGGSQLIVEQGMAVNVGHSTSRIGMIGNKLEIDDVGTKVFARYLQLGGGDATDGLMHLKEGILKLSNPGGPTYLLVSTGSGNKVVIDGGELIVEGQNVGTPANIGYIRASSGTDGIEINGGKVTTDNLRRGTGDALISFNGGLLQARSSTHGGGAFVVGDGMGSKATFELLNDGKIASSHSFSSLEVKTDGRLIGSGDITNHVTIAGELSAGNDDVRVGEISINGNLTLESTALTSVDLASNLSFDTLELKGTRTLTYAGTLKVSLTDSYAPVDGLEYQLFTANTYVGNFSSFDFSNAVLGSGLQWKFDATTGTLSVIPEPSVIFLLMGALVLFGMKRSRSRKHV